MVTRPIALRRAAAAAGISIALGAAALVAPTAAFATTGTNPANYTPQIQGSDSVVRDLYQCGSLMFAVGSFSHVLQVPGHKTVARSNAFSFNVSNGYIGKWNPHPDAEVNTVVTNHSCSRVFIGGRFKHAGGVAALRLAKTYPKSGHVESSFKHKADAEVDTLSLVHSGDHLMVGGRFTRINGKKRVGLASMSPTSGTVGSYYAGSVSGHLTSGGTSVYNSQVSPHGRSMMVEGNFTTFSNGAHHATHHQIAMFAVSASHIRLRSWAPPAMNTTSCSDTERFYVRSAAFGPGGRRVFLATTGDYGTSPYCDAAVALGAVTARRGWINYTGGDSLYSIVASTTDVYIGGHERWADNGNAANPAYRDQCNTTLIACKVRKGIGDIGNGTGKATSWNPSRSRGNGADAMVLTGSGPGRGLWVGSDTAHDATKCGGETHPGICYFPRA